MSRQTVVKRVLVDTLEIGYEESGPANSNPIILLHGFPDDARAWEYKGWYQWYFQTERGRAGLQRNRRDICRLLWELWCPNWKFTAAAFDETARSFDNPDFVDIVIHSYRYRHRAAVGDPNLETIEKRLSTRPTIGVPTIVLHGEGDTIHPPEMSKAQEKLFSAHYERRVTPLAGHLFPREAPGPVITAVQDLNHIPSRLANPQS